MSSEIIEEIKSKIDIVSLIGETVKLKRQGNLYVGATSSSSKSGASLKIDPKNQLYNNFAEENGGDVFNWIAYREGLDIVSDFPRILEIAAEKAGIVLEHQDNALLSERSLMHPFFRAAAGYYHSQLTEECRAYIHSKWGINDEMIDKLLIGWAPENCHLQNELHDLFPEDVMRMSGLFNVTTDSKMRDIFRGRIIFPYWKGGKVVYFIGRDPNPKENIPKYFKQLVHSKQRPYISSTVDNSVFYGEDSIKKADSVIITEGVTDCIKVLQEGLACISPVTVRIKDEQKEHAYQLVKNKDEVIICNDNEDNDTGKKGAIATAEYLESRGVPVRVVELPRPDGVDKIDLAEFLQDNSKEDFLQLESNNVWEIKLNSQNIPDKAIDRFQAAKRFIQNELKQLDPAMRRIFIRNDVKEYFNLQNTDISEILKHIKFEDDIPDKDEDDGFFTERGNLRVKKLGEYVMSLHRFITFEDTKNIFHYCNGVYVPGGEDIIARIVQTSLGDASKKRHISEILNFVQLETLIPRNRINHDLKRINLLNGLYNLETNQLEPHTSDYISIVQLPVLYDPDAKCPLIEKFVSEVLEPKRVPVIYEILGYCMIPDTRIEKSVMFLGKGANGKSVMLSMFGEFLGGQNTSAESLHMLEKDPYSTAELYGKLANIFPDLASRAIYENSTFKMLTGNEKEIRAQRKFEHPFKFKNTARLIFSANELPPVPGHDFAYFRRWVLLKFPNTYEGKRADKNLIDKLTQPGELSGLFNLCVKALKVLLQRGEYSYDLTTEEVMKLYRINSDPIAQFADDCILHSEQHTAKSVMYNHYILWCKKNEIEPQHTNVFSKRFKKLGYDDGRGGSDGDRYYMWKNCSFNTNVQGDKICMDAKKQMQEPSTSIRPSISLHCSNNQDNTTVCSIDNNSHNMLQYGKCMDAWTYGNVNSPIDNDLPASGDTSMRPDVDENTSNSFEIPKKLGTFFDPDETLVSQDAIYSVIQAVMKTTYKREHIVAQCKMLNVSCGGERLDLLKKKGVIHEKPNGDLVWVGG
ncbi:phage/plasmid primase, P4 family [uncultured Methanolobus sp.]|uniref:phage/plasmid primase, P4 family n=1 Tax=uncultured Methanolobus sp. TaxID=218300 RepID=UPI0029C6E68E|nr:phage/plasmid primase, P4 family [uncultured Methanolobus sp.]